MKREDSAHYSILKESDWDFSRVPEEEIIACCLWEYARESASIGMAAEMARLRDRKADNVSHESKAETAEHERRIMAQAKRSGFNYEKFLGRFWACDVGFIRFFDSLREYVSPRVLPWQDQRRRFRSLLVKQLTEATIFGPLMPSTIGELEQLWETNSKELKLIRLENRDPNDDNEALMLYDSTAPLSVLPEKKHQAKRRVTMAFTVDFSRFTDREIEDSFRAWLKSNRLKKWRSPESVFPTAARRGRKANDYKVALERLGLMRLLHWGTPRMVRSDMPRAWAIYERKEQVFRREIRAAVKFFHEHFPFLPKNERPESFERYMTWMRPMQKICDQLDAEWGNK